MLLAQEIIRDINLRKKYHNVVDKLGKAYNIVSCVFVTKVLRRFVFAETIIDMARLLSNN